MHKLPPRLYRSPSPFVLGMVTNWDRFSYWPDAEFGTLHPVWATYQCSAFGCRGRVHWPREIECGDCLLWRHCSASPPVSFELFERATGLPSRAILLIDAFGETASYDHELPVGTAYAFSRATTENWLRCRRFLPPYLVRLPRPLHVASEHDAERRMLQDGRYLPQPG